MNSHKYLVTGAAGFIGSHLIAGLLDKGHEVVGVDNFSDYYASSIKKSNISEISSIQGNFEMRMNSIEDFDSNFYGDFDGIFHLAAQPGVRSSWGIDFEKYVKLNVLATQNILEKSRGKVPIVYASSSSVYGDASEFPLKENCPPQPISPYGVTKLSCEALAFAYSKLTEQSIAGLRFFTVYGPRQRPDMAFTRICRALLTGETFEIFGSGEQIRDFTFVTDAVDATIAVMENELTGVFNIGGGQEVSLNEAIALFEKASGRQLNRRFILPTKGDVLRTGSSIDRINDAVGWKPKINIEFGVKKQWEWALDHAELIIEQQNFR